MSDHPQSPTPQPRERTCPLCSVFIDRERHANTCPDRLVPGKYANDTARILGPAWKVLRLAGDAAGRRLEDLLERCTKRACEAWVRSGRSL